jgi:hypothetical protein
MTYEPWSGGPGVGLKPMDPGNAAQPFAIEI